MPTSSRKHWSVARARDATHDELAIGVYDMNLMDLAAAIRKTDDALRELLTKKTGAKESKSRSRSRSVHVSPQYAMQMAQANTVLGPNNVPIPPKSVLEHFDAKSLQRMEEDMGFPKSKTKRGSVLRISKERTNIKTKRPPLGSTDQSYEAIADSIPADAILEDMSKLDLIDLAEIAGISNARNIGRGKLIKLLKRQRHLAKEVVDSKGDISVVELTPQQKERHTFRDERAKYLESEASDATFSRFKKALMDLKGKKGVDTGAPNQVPERDGARVLDMIRTYFEKSTVSPAKKARVSSKLGPVVLAFDVVFSDSSDRYGGGDVSVRTKIIEMISMAENERERVDGPVESYMQFLDSKLSGDKDYDIGADNVLQSILASVTESRMKGLIWCDIASDIIHSYPPASVLQIMNVRSRLADQVGLPPLSDEDRKYLINKMLSKKSVLLLSSLMTLVLTSEQLLDAILFAGGVGHIDALKFLLTRSSDSSDLVAQIAVKVMVEKKRNARIRILRALNHVVDASQFIIWYIVQLPHYVKGQTKERIHELNAVFNMVDYDSKVKYSLILAIVEILQKHVDDRSTTNSTLLLFLADYMDIVDLEASDLDAAAQLQLYKAMYGIPSSVSVSAGRNATKIDLFVSDALANRSEYESGSAKPVVWKGEVDADADADAERPPLVPYAEYKSEVDVDAVRSVGHEATQRTASLASKISVTRPLVTAPARVGPINSQDAVDHIMFMHKFLGSGDRNQGVTYADAKRHVVKKLKDGFTPHAIVKEEYASMNSVVPFSVFMNNVDSTHVAGASCAPAKDDMHSCADNSDVCYLNNYECRKYDSDPELDRKGSSLFTTSDGSRYYGTDSRIAAFTKEWASASTPKKVSFSDVKRLPIPPRLPPPTPMAHVTSRSKPLPQKENAFAPKRVSSSDVKRLTPKSPTSMTHEPRLQHKKEKAPTPQQHRAEEQRRTPTAAEISRTLSSPPPLPLTSSPPPLPQTSSPPPLPSSIELDQAHALAAKVEPVSLSADNISMHKMASLLNARVKDCAKGVRS